MAITIKKVSTKRELKKFIRFNYRMYKGNPYSVPDLYDDMLNTFNKKKNAAFEFCEADYFLAYRDDKIVGRVAAIINNQANKKWECKNVRFGWIDFIDDPEVSSALIKTVEEWSCQNSIVVIYRTPEVLKMPVNGITCGRSHTATHVERITKAKINDFSCGDSGDRYRSEGTSEK